MTSWHRQYPPISLRPIPHKKTWTCDSHSTLCPDTNDLVWKNYCGRYTTIISVVSQLSRLVLTKTTEKAVRLLQAPVILNMPHKRVGVLSIYAFLPGRGRVLLPNTRRVLSEPPRTGIINQMPYLLRRKLPVCCFEGNKTKKQPKQSDILNVPSPQERKEKGKKK